MNWVKFLADCRKIAIAVALLALLYSTFLMPNLVTFAFFLPILILPEEFVVLSAGGIRNPAGLTFLGWIAAIAYSFLISCLIVWLYDKIKKK
jgi:hypothetical protein